MMMMTEMADDQKRRSHHHDGFMLQAAATGGGGCSAKKVKTGGGGGSISPKEKKDKVGERVAALQQLVSPFGKTDTASVLQDATGYIKFLHDQLQLLSAPYLRTGPDGNMQGLSSIRASLTHGHQFKPRSEHILFDLIYRDGVDCSLRSRGLCLMPIESTLKIARSNGADLWAPTNASSRGQ